jgi:hypothetical protein
MAALQNGYRAGLDEGTAQTVQQGFDEGTLHRLNIDTSLTSDPIPVCIHFAARCCKMLMCWDGCAKMSFLCVFNASCIMPSVFITGNEVIY